MHADRPLVLQVDSLRRSYGRLSRVEAVRGVSFDVRRGEIVGLVGPDGAGKTSVMQMLAGVLSPHGGTATVNGVDAARGAEQVKRRIGYMPQGLGSNLYDSLTVHENIEFFRELRKLPADVYARNRAELLAATRLEPFLHRRAATLSGGMRQKLALVCTLIHLPDVLLLDEPTTGVDPISRQEFWQIVRRVVEERLTTVLLSTSYMDEAERCHRIALMHEGAIVAEGTPESVRQRATGRFGRLVAQPQAAALRLLRARSDVDSTEVFGEAIRFRFSGELREIEGALVAGSIAIVRLAIEEPRLEDVFLQLLAGAEAQAPAFRFPARQTASSDAAVECRGVTHRFGRFTAVDHVDLSVRRGEIFGLLGPNGAGKTTLIKMLCGLLPPTDGAIAIGGMDVRTERSRLWTALGYMSQRFSLYQDLTVRQNLQLYADLYDLRASTSTDVATWLGLDPYLPRLTKDLPAGVRQRVSLLCAVLHRPAIVLLDEPTSGVDPQARRLFWDLIYSLSRDAGITVLVSTHHMDEASHCDRLALMHDAALIADGSPAELQAASERRSGSLLAITAADPGRAFQVLAHRGQRPSLYGDELRIRSRDPDGDRLALTALFEREHAGRVQIDQVPLSMEETFIDFIDHAEAAHG
ncbi:MAG TPA: ATP-binding cassette domain-containing protein [Vicinamibacterales bacterium]|nr:ATP-binding cassette domain-containing protein [Vicinamibacterales bacterium]